MRSQPEGSRSRGLGEAEHDPARLDSLWLRHAPDGASHRWRDV